MTKVLGHVTSTVQAVFTACNVEFLLSSATSDLSGKIKGFLTKKYNSKQEFQTGTLMVYSEFGYLQWSIPSTLTTTGFATSQCLSSGLGIVLQEKGMSVI